MNEFKVKRFNLQDWEDQKLIRLESLVEHPEYFCPSRDETKFSEQDWKQRIQSPNSAGFGLFDPKGNIIGLTAIVREGNDSKSTRAQLVSSYIRKKYRGRGLSQLLYKSRIEWAKDQGDIDTLIVEFAEDNLASQRACDKFDFKMVESKDETWGNNELKKCLVYQLKLK